MKHFAKILLAISLLGMSACSKPKDEVVEEVVVDETVVENNFYKAPLKPTSEQISLFNNLSTLMNNASRTEEQEAKLVAENFAMQFFSFAGKESRNDVGGMMYIPSTMQEDFKSYAQAYFYSHLEELELKYGKAELPYVVSVQVSNVVAQDVNYKDLVYDGYVMDVELTYKDNKSSKSNELKTKFKITLCKAEDYKDYEGTEAYLKSLGETDIVDEANPLMIKNEIYRVIAIED